MDRQNSPGNEPLASRRSVLGTLGFGSLALLASPSTASAFLAAKSPMSSGVDLSGLPEEWVARQGSNLALYATYLQSIRLQRLQPRQVIEAHAKQHGGVWNSLPPRNLWAYTVPTLRVIDRVAMELNQPVKEIVSAYRNPAYNARCPGARSGSWHQANVAVDVVFPRHSSAVAQVTRNLRGRGLFQGGVGHYPTFTHIDTRGQNVDW